MTYLRVSDLHEIYYELHGNPSGAPAVVLHGGPGAGFGPDLPDLFDLDRYFVVLFDQRGAMRSRPFASMEENTTHHLVDDIEKLRVHLGIERWLVFGGSWGSFLGMLYGQRYPERVTGFVLRGILLGRSKDLRFCQLVNGEKEAYHEFVAFFPEEERADLLAPSYRRVMDPDPAVHLPLAHCFLRHWTLSTTSPHNLKRVLALIEDDQLTLSLSRAALHYTVHGLFVEEGHLLDHMGQISHLPAILVHGESDRNCLPEGARILHERWPKSELWMVPGGGHFTTDPLIADALRRASSEISLQIDK